MLEIPKQLQNEKFRFILIAKNSKRPIENEWTTKANYKFNDPKLIKHLEDGNNYGVLCGPGNLFVIDIDVKNAKPNDFDSFKNLETFMVLTGGGGLHIYLLCSDEIINYENESLSIGELKLKGVQVVGPNSTYTNGLTKYSVIKDNEIVTIAHDKFDKFYEEIISPYKKKNVIINELDNTVGESVGDTSRSGIDFKTLRFLIQSNLTQEKIFEQMKESSIRWNGLPKSKQEWEYNNAKKSLEKFPEKTFKQRQYESQFREETVKSKEFNFLTDTELLNYVEKPNIWLVNKLLIDNTINVLAGKRSTMKSWLALILAFCVGESKNFLDKYQCSKGKVLYIDRENSLNDLKKRQQMIVKSLNIEQLNSNVIFLSEQHLKLDSSSDIMAIEKFVIENQIKLIIVDTYRRVISFKEDSADEVSRFFNDVIKSFIERTKTTFLFLHHEKKGMSQGDEMDMLRGSSDLANFVDGVIQIKRKGRILTLVQTKLRQAVEQEPLQIKIETDEESYFRASCSADAIISLSDRISQKICDWVLANKIKKFTYTEIVSRFIEFGYKRNNISNALVDLQRQGMLTKGSNLRDPYIVNFGPQQDVLF